MNQSNYIDWDAIPDDNTLPTGTFHVRCDTLEDGFAGSGKRMFKGKFTVVAPQQYAGMSHYENYVTGNEEDMAGLVPGTFGMRSLKQFWTAAQVPRNPDPAIMCQSSNGTQCLMLVNQSEDTDPNSQYYRQKQNKVVKYLKVGEAQVGVLNPTGGNVPAATGQVVAAPVAAAPQAAPVVAPPVAQQAPAPPMQTPAPVAAPLTNPPPAAPIPPNPPPAAAPPAPAPNPVPAPEPPAAAGPTLVCNLCNPPQRIPFDQYEAHIEQHQQAGQ